MPPERPLLIISRNLPPVVGGIERLMHRLVQELSVGNECLVIGPRGCRRHLPTGVQVIEIPHRPAVLFVLLAMIATAFGVLSRRPRAVLAGNGLMSLAAVPAKLSGVPVVTMVYGLDVVTDNRLYQAVCLPLIRSSDAVIACSSNTARLARERGVEAARLAIVIPGVDMPERKPSPASISRIDNGRPLLVSVGRLVRRKGVAEFIRHALPAIVARIPDVRYVVIGAAPTVSLQRELSEPQRINAAVTEAGMEDHVELAGFVDDESLASWLAVACVHVFPVLDLPQDVEGFGLVALEAAAHGVPTIAFDAGGVGDAVSDGKSGQLIPAGDYRTLAQSVCMLVAADRASVTESCRGFAAVNSWSRYAEQVLRVIDRAARKESVTGTSNGSST